MGVRHGLDFDAIHRELRGRVFALGWRMTGDAAAAEDVVQETFLLVHRFLPRFRGEASVSTWVFRIALRVAGKERRRRRARPAEPLAPREAERLAARPDLRSAEECEEADRVLRALSELSDEHRAVLTLLALDGLTTAEIAGVLRVPEGTVWSRAHAGRKRLLALLGAPVAPRA